MTFSDLTPPRARAVNRSLRLARVVIMAGCVAFGFSSTSLFAAEPIAVTTQRLDELVINSELSAPAIVVAANRSTISSQVAALVTEIFVDVGSSVKKGDLLIRLDDSDGRLALATAKANLAATEARIDLARSRVKNAEDLLARNFISDEELLSRQTDLAVNIATRNSHIAAVSSQDLALSRTRIKAPYAAVVTARSAQLGAYVGPGSPLMTLVQNDQREVDVEIDPRSSGSLSLVREFQFESRGTSWPVALERLSSVIEADSRIQHARFKFVSEPAPIGSSGKVNWLAEIGLIPAAYVVQRGAALGVFKANDDHAVFIPLPQAQEGRPVATDLAGDTILIIGGRARIQDGDPITISE